LVRRKTADQENFADLVFLFYGPTCADRSLAAECQNPFQIGMGKHRIDGGLVAFVDALSDAVAVSSQLHIRKMFLLVGDCGVSPGVVQRHG
jgi:hypothetical protein